VLWSGTNYQDILPLPVSLLSPFYTNSDGSVVVGRQSGNLDAAIWRGSGEDELIETVLAGIGIDTTTTFPAGLGSPAGISADGKVVVGGVTVGGSWIARLP
jgi:hypothetical protein